MARKGFGRVLKTLRTSKKMSLRDLAERADVPPGYLSELEGGKKKNPSLDVLKKLARALGVPVGELLE
jgi:transcriptional regulator with XRE-family HTH domain